MSEEKKVYYRCSLCFEGGTEEFYNKMINYDSLVLCPNCYKRYTESKYNEIAMLHNSIRMYRRIIEQQQKEIEEKRIIIFAGAEKVKQLEKGNRSLMESRIKWKSRYYRERAKNKEYIRKDIIRQKIKEVQETICPKCCACGLCDEFKELLERK